MSLLDVLLPGRRRALEGALEQESAARAEAEAELARERTARAAVEVELAEWVNDHWGAAGDAIEQRERAENAEAHLARIRDGLANCAQPSGETDIATTLGQVIFLKDALLVASEHATDGWREQYRVLYEQIVDRALDALGLPEHDQLHQGLRDSLRLDRAGVS